MPKADEKQEAVTPVETTTETESAPVETNTDSGAYKTGTIKSVVADSVVEEPEVPQETPVVESNDTVESPQESNVSQSVPYERFAEVNAEKKALEQQLSMQQQAANVISQPAQDIPELDPDAAKAVDYKVRQIVEQQKVAEFDAKHAKEFAKDPLLKAALSVEFQDAQSKGQYFDLEAGLEQAKAKLEARLKPQVEAAIQEGVKEGQDIARTKQQLGAVGEPGKVPEVDEDKLSAREFAKLNNLPRIN